MDGPTSSAWVPATRAGAVRPPQQESVYLPFRLHWYACGEDLPLIYPTLSRLRAEAIGSTCASMHRPTGDGSHHCVAGPTKTGDLPLATDVNIGAIADRPLPPRRQSRPPCSERREIHAA